MKDSNHLARAEVLYDMSRYNSCLRELESHLAGHPNDERAEAIRACCLTRLSRLDEALESTNRAIGLNPEYAYAFLAAYHVRMARGEVRKAEIAIRESIRLDSANADSYFCLAWLLFHDDRLKQAHEVCNASLAINPQYVDSLMLRSKILARLGNTEEADSLLQEALSIDPLNPHAHDQRAHLFMWKREWGDALNHFTEARRLSPVEKENLVSIAEAAAQNTKPFQLASLLVIRWHRWNWFATWLAFAVLACSFACISIVASQTRLPTWTAWFWGSVILIWVFLPLSYYLAALLIGGILESRAQWKEYERVIACTFVVGVAIFPILVVLALFYVVPFLPLAVCGLIMCASSMRAAVFLPPSKFSIAGYGCCFALPMLLGIIAVTTFTLNPRLFILTACPFLVSSLIANLLVNFGLGSSVFNR